MKPLLIVGAIIILGGGGFAAFWFFGRDSESLNTNQSNNINIFQNVNTNVPVNTNSAANIPVGLATPINYSIQTARLFGLSSVLESYYSEFETYPESLTQISDNLRGCKNKTTQWPQSLCDVIQEPTQDFALVLEDVYTGQKLAYVSDGSSYSLRYTIKFYDGLPDADKQDISDGQNTMTDELFSASPSIDLSHQDSYWQRLRGAGCYVVNNKIIADSMPENSYTKKWLALFLNRKKDQIPCDTQDVATDWRKQLVTDTDQDGLVEILEYAHGTQDTVADTDGDGFTDLQELQNGFNPNGPGKLEFVADVDAGT